MAKASPTVAMRPMISVATACGVQSVYSMGWCPFARSFPRTVCCTSGFSPGATERASGGWQVISQGLGITFLSHVHGGTGV